MHRQTEEELFAETRRKGLTGQFSQRLTGVISAIFIASGVGFVLPRSNSVPTSPHSASAERKSSSPAKLRVGYWNIRDLSVRSRSQAELREIAGVAHAFDCIAICEINDDVVLRKLVAELQLLGGRWENTQTHKIGNTPSSSEYYGFLWRSDRLRLRAGPRTLKERLYQVPGDRKRYRFDREPAVSSFATLDGGLDFTAIVVHVTWGKSVALRKGEIRTLKEYFEEVRDGSLTDKDILLGGDFNSNVGDKDSLSVLLEIPTMIDTTLPSIPTVVKSENTYDHILFQTQYVREYSGVHGLDPFDERVFHGDKKRAVKVCSDHRPVWVELKVPSRDDD